MAGAAGPTSGVPGEPAAPTLGDYVLIRRLGQGGMGQVWLAKLRGRGLAGIDKLCVVKTLRSSDDPEYERRFIDEARLIVLLTHKNICPVFDAGCFEGLYYVAMEHIAGRDLHALSGLSREQETPLPVPVAIHIAKELLEALDAAHRMVHPITQQPLLIVHRDVSPQNVMVSAEGDVKLIDFGLAASSQKAEKTEPRVVMGKLAYMAPEQARGEALDDRTDQFAAGVILYELLANARYYEGLTTTETWGRVGTGGYEPAGLARLEPALAAIVRRATAARREDRYATCGDMCEALTAVELSRGAIASSRDVRLAVVELERQAGLESTTSPELRRLERGILSAPPLASASSSPPLRSGPGPVAVSASVAVSPGRLVSVPPSVSGAPSSKETGEPPSALTSTTSSALPSPRRLAGPMSASLPSLRPWTHQAPAVPEQTRTFRVRRGQNGEPLVELPQSHSQEGSALDETESGSMVQFLTLIERTEDAGHMPTNADQPALGVSDPPPPPPAAVTPARRIEPTVLVRDVAGAPSPQPPRPGRSRRVAAVFVALSAGLGTMMVWRASRAVTPVDNAVGNIDAGVSVVAALTSPSTALPAAAVDAGVVGGVPDEPPAPTVVDAGVVNGAHEEPKVPTLVDAGVAAPVENPSTPSGGKGGKAERPRTRRQLDPLPEGPQLVRAKFLKEHCGDLGCYEKVQGELGTDVAESLIRDCYKQCVRTPR